MSHRAQQLHATADEQVAGLIEMLSAAEPEALQRPCPGREKLGDGTIGTIAAHTALNYQRIGRFVAGGEASAAGPHDEGLSAAHPQDIVARLTHAREDLARIAELSEQQLDAVPPKDTFRFCDGERTLEQVVLGLLRHQDHQVQALRAALSGSAPGSPRHS